MKIGKLHKESGILKVLLGLAVAGALLFASCQNIFDMADSKPQDDGYGYVIVDLGDAAGRTVRPGGDLSIGDGTDTTKFAKFIYKFDGVAADGKTPLNIHAEWDTLTADPSKPFYLPVGKYKLTVSGLVDELGDGSSYLEAVTGSYNGENGEEVFQVNANVTTTVNVALKAKVGANDKGTLKIDIKLPTGAAYVFKLQQYNPVTGVLNTTPVTLTYSPVTNPTNSAGAVTSTYTGAAGSAGSYLFTGRINTADGRFGGFSEAVHIVANMTTVFEKDFTVTGGLAKITDPKEAIEILKTEIKDWFTPATNVNILPSVSGIEYLDSTGAIETAYDAGGTIRINYIQTEMAKVSTPASLITLQGGWTVTKRGSDNASTWSLSNSATSGAVFTLENQNVVVTPAGSAPAVYTTYKVELRPVAEFRVSFGDGVNTDKGRALNSFKDKDGKDIALTPAFSAADPQAVRKGISPIGDTAITVTEAAVTITEVTTPPQTSQVPQPVVSNVVTPAFTAASKVYEFKIYETPEDQWASALIILKRDITGTKPDSSPAAAWVDSAVRPALAKIDPQVEANLIIPPASAADTQEDTVIYYVQSRLPQSNTSTYTTGTFPINVPKDPRWDVSNNWNLTNPTTNATGDYKQIGFTPYGGTRKAYDLLLKPVAEYYVDFAPETVGTDPFDPEDEDNLDAVTISGGSVKVTSGPSAAATEFTFSTTNIDGKRFELGNTTIALAEVAIEIDETTATTDYTDNFENVYKSPLTTVGGPAILADVVGYTAPGTTTPSSGSYTLTGATSREYRIKVYPSIDAQRKAAQNLLKDEDTTTVDRWINNTASLSTTTRTLAYVAASSGLPASDLVYVSTTEPVLRLPIDIGTTYISPYTSAKGWAALDSTTPTLDDFNKKVVPVKFTYRGGIGFQETIHNFNVIAAAAVKITFAKLPSGANPTTPSVTVKGLNPGLSSDYTSPSSISSDTTVLIGSGNVTGTVNKIQVNSTVSNPNIISFPGTVSATVTGNKTSDLSITATAGNPILSQEYAFTVYPSTKDQVEDVTTKLKSLETLAGWGSFTATTSVSGKVNNTPTTALDTTFQIIGALPAVNTLVPVSGAFLTADYNGTITHGPIGTASDVDATKGTRNDTIKFLAIGGTASTSTAASANQELWYTFKLVQVARYTVNFMPGPILPATQTQGNVQILTFEPGTGAVPTTNGGYVGISQSTSKVYIGGIGTSATVGITSTFGDGSIFTTNIKNDGTKDSAQSSPVTSLAATLAVTSDDFTIEVYPTVADQRRQVIAKLSDSTNTNATFFASAVLSRLKTTIKPITGDISEIQYLGTVPVPDAALLTGLLNSGLGYALASGTSDNTAPPSYGADKLAINFTPVMPAAAASKVYDFRRIPLGQFTVTYGVDNLGNLAARGTVRVQPATPSTSVPNEKELTFAASTAPSAQLVQLGTGAVTIRIDSPADTDYSTVIIRKASDNSYVTELTPPSTATVAKPTPNVYTWTPAVGEAFDYTILVVKTGQ